MKQEYISIVSKEGEGRTSTLDIHSKSTPEAVHVMGNLPHGYAFEPKTAKDAQALIDWLQWWIEEKKQC